MRHEGGIVNGTFSDKQSIRLNLDQTLAQRLNFVLSSEIIQVLSETRPDIVYVALGSPKQEKLIARLRPVLPGAWWLGVGNSFSFLSGEVRRAPVWMQRTGVEWVHRLIQEPRRLFRRYVVDGLPFAARMFAAALRARFGAEA